MSSEKKVVRQRFRDAVFGRDDHRCRVCSSHVESLAPKHTSLDAHHITDRTLMPNGGYVPENGITLCNACHEQAEQFHKTGMSVPGFSPSDLYKMIGSSYDKALRASQKLAAAK